MTYALQVIVLHEEIRELRVQLAVVLPPRGELDQISLVLAAAHVPLNMHLEVGELLLARLAEEFVARHLEALILELDEAS